jgi:hypothetical protein
VKSGDHIDTLSIAIGRGAAYLAGSMTPAADGGTLPPRAVLCLVPAEPERAADVLFYKQVAIASDGKFAIANIPPGKYRAVAVPGPSDDSPDVRWKQIAWDVAARKQLRQRADTDGVELDLAPRKRVKDFALKFD